MNKINTLNPYIGPRPFRREEKNLFFGRDAEADILISEIIEKEVVILYGLSGAGKTSLINACLIDLLEIEGFRVFKIDRIGEQINKVDNLQNIFVFNTLRHLTSDRIGEQEFLEIDLNNFIAKYYHDKLMVLIFDQFEEIFTSHIDRWQDRVEFLKQVQELCEQFPNIKVVFAIREDFLGSLNSYSKIWGKKPFYFRFELLNKNKALDAVIKPIEQTSRKYDIGIAEKIVNELLQTKFQDQDGRTKIIEGEFVEPVQLQIVCKTLWDGLQAEEKIITHKHLMEIGGVEKSLEDFYGTALQRALEKYPDKEKEVRNWIEKMLITPIKTRGSALYGNIESDGIPNTIINSFINSYLIRTEKRAGARWISLSHDRFIEPILKSNHQWQENQLMKKQEIQKKKRKIAYAFISILFVFVISIAFYMFWSYNRKAHRWIEFVSSQFIDIITSNEVIVNEKLKMIDDMVNEREIDKRSVVGEGLLKLEEVEKKEIERLLVSINCSTQEGMVFIPEGKFLYGGSSEEEDLPQEIDLLGFYIDKYPVTNAEYLKFLDNTRGGQHGPYCHFNENKQIKSNHKPKFWGEPQYRQYSSKPDDPVIFIDWYDAYAYAKWAGKRLPTEQEWEKAARGLYGRKYPWGYFSNYDEISPGPFPINQKLIDLPSPFGCYDMVGKIWQWTNSQKKDLNDVFVSKCVLRGAPYKGEQLKFARVTVRSQFYPGFSNYDIGFRCVKDCPQ